MPDSIVHIGRGGVLLKATSAPSNLDNPTDSIEKLLRLRYEITSGGIQFYRQPTVPTDTPNRRDAVAIFEVLDELLAVPGATLQSQKGHLALVSLPATPDAAFYTVTLQGIVDSNPTGTASVSAIVLAVQRSQPFASAAHLSFQDLALQFTVNRATPGLQVSGGVTLTLFGQSISLQAVLSEQGLLFRPVVSNAPSSLVLNGLGSLNLATLEVGSSSSSQRWNELETLYSFDEGGGNKILDSAGIRSIDNREQVPLDLDIHTPDRITRTETGITVGRDAVITSTPLRQTDATKIPKIIPACRKSNALSIEAWVRSDATTLPEKAEAPPRIVTLSKDISTRNFLLAQGGTERREGGDFYGVRLRRTKDSKTDDNGLPPLVSNRGALTTQLSYVAFTRDRDGTARLYVNGIDQTDANRPADLGGDFNQWDDSFQLAIANEITRNRPWAGDLQRIAIYSRALSPVEIEQSYFPALRVQLTLANVPAPLTTVGVEIRALGDRTQLLYRPSAPLSITPDFRLEQTNVRFELQAGNPTWVVTGSAQAHLWDLAIGKLVPRLTLNADGQPTVALVRQPDPDTSLELAQLGRLVLGAFELQGTLGGWQIVTTGQITFSVLPPPLQGALPIGLAIADNTLFLTLNPTPPLTLVEQLVFDRVNLRFQRIPTGWAVLGDVGLKLFGNSVPLVPSFATDEPGHPFTLTFLANPERPAGLSTPPGELYLSRLRLRAVTPTSNVFWSVFMSGVVELTNNTGLDRLGTLMLGTEGQIQGNLTSPQQPTQLQGKSILQSASETLFRGDLQAQGDRLVLTGKFTLFTEGSPLRFNEDAQITLGPVVQLRLLRPLTVNLPNFELRNPQLTLTDGQMALSGTWLGESVTLWGSQRGQDFILRGLPTFVLPFGLNLGAIYEPQTAVKLTDFLRSPQTGTDSRTIQVNVQLELSQGGVQTTLAGVLQADDADGQIQELRIPDVTVYTPPPNRNALLQPLMTELKLHAHEIIAPQFRQATSYRLTVPGAAGAASRAVLVYLGTATGAPTEPLVVSLPLVFAAPDQTVADSKGRFRLEQTDRCLLTIDLADQSGAAIALAYREFLSQLAVLENPGRSLLPGAIALIKRQIAERVPMPINQVLFYYYGLETGDGGQIDLQPGMRLRVDFQNYQDVPPNERTAIAINGFVGSGTTYFSMHSYPNPAAPGQFLLGFDPFIARIPFTIQADASKDGAGSIIDIHKPGFRFPYYRLFYPGQFSNIAAPKGAERTITLVGAASLADLETATDLYRKNGSVQTSETRIGFFFRGRVTVIPEIIIFVQEQPLYVSLGTTLRQVAERFTGIPVSALRGQRLQPFQGALRPRRLVHSGVNSSPTYRFIDLDSDLSNAEGNDAYDLPVVQGDRFYF